MKSEWRTMPASEYCNSVVDGTHDSPKQAESGKYLITSKHLREYELDFENAYKISLNDYEKVIVRSKVEQWDILFSMIGTIGRVYQESNSKTDYAIKNVGLFKLGGDKLKSDWLKYYLMSPKAQEYISSRLRGSTQGYIPLGSLRDMPIEVPDISVQAEIAATLSCLDDKIENNTKINNCLEQIAFAIFDDMFPYVSCGEHTIGMYIIPKHGRGLLSKEAVFGDVPVIAGGLSPAAYHNAANTIAPVLTISASGANSGFVSLWGIPVWSSDSSFIDSSMTADVYFWYAMLKKRQDEIYDAQTGSAQPHIYPKHIEIMPTIELNQKDITAYTQQVAPLFKEISVNIQESARLAALRDALLPRLMSGELSVADIGDAK
jgi:type I restriction enzyme S subunit